MLIIQTLLSKEFRRRSVRQEEFAAKAAMVYEGSFVEVETVRAA